MHTKILCCTYQQRQKRATMVEEVLCLDDFAAICENQEELANLILQEVPFYAFKTESGAHLTSEADIQVGHFIDYDEAMTTDITDIAHEETCCSNDCYNELSRSPLSEDSAAHTSPHQYKRHYGSRKVRTPNTMQHILEKHRHSERKRHHSLNERLKVICELVPGSITDNRETKVVMMQRVISYISYLENSLRLLCAQTSFTPLPSWTSLTTNLKSYFHDYFKGIEDSDVGDEVLTATENLTRLQQEAEENDDYDLVYKTQSSSPSTCSFTVVNNYNDAAEDSVVPEVTPPAIEGEEIVVLSQDSGVAASSVGGDDDDDEDEEEEGGWDIANNDVWAMKDTYSMQGDEFFKSAIEEGVSVTMEVASSAMEVKQRIDNRGKETSNPYNLCGPDNRSTHPINGALVPHPLSSLFTIQKCVPSLPPPQQPHRKHKRKQLSPRKSAASSSQADYLSDRAYLPSWSTATDPGVGKDTSKNQPRRVLPYNIRDNHRHPVQRLQATAAKISCLGPSQTALHISCLPATQQPERAVVMQAGQKEDGSTKLDLRKTTWMNGFMMFSRMNRRHFIQAHPGVHTSHISKIMGHAWRNMSKEEQAPYKEKAQVCAKELYRAYTSQPIFTSQPSPSPPTPSPSITTTAVLSLLPPPPPPSPNPLPQ